jgi:hypothetical protein
VPDRYLTTVLFYQLSEDSVVANSLAYQLSQFSATTLAIIVHLPILLIAPVGLWAARRDAGTRGRDLLWLWGLTSFGGAALGGNWFPHYYQQVLPPLTVALVLGMREIQNRGYRTGSAILAASILLLGLQFVWILSRSSEPAKLIVDYTPSRAASHAVATYIHERTAPDDTIYVVYQQPDIYYLSRRRPAARWLNNPELMRTADAFDEQVARLADPATAPRYIVVSQPFEAFGFDSNGASRAIVARDYTFETTVSGITLYRRGK